MRLFTTSLLRPSHLVAGSLLHGHRWLTSTRPLLNTADQHHDLDTFVQYAQSSGLDPATTIFVGTAFEYTVMVVLSAIGMSLTRSGGRFDAGIDIKGTWIPPTTEAVPARPPVNIYVSCKSYNSKRKTGPNILRELVGTVNATPRDVDAFGILATAQPCTKETRQRLAMSTAALGFMCVTPPEVRRVKRGPGRPPKDKPAQWELVGGGRLKQFIWNDAASEMLGRSLGCTARYVLPKEGEKLEGNEKMEEVVLTLDGIPIKPKPKRKRSRKKLDDI